MAAQYNFLALKAGYIVRAYFFSTEIRYEQLTHMFAQLHFNGAGIVGADWDTIEIALIRHFVVFMDSVKLFCRSLRGYFIPYLQQ